MKNLKRTLISAICVMMLLFGVIPVNSIQAQDAPIKFQYSSKGYIDREGDKLYWITECTKFEGESCTAPGVAIRMDMTFILDIAKMLSRIRI